MRFLGNWVSKRFSEWGETKVINEAIFQQVFLLSLGIIFKTCDTPRQKNATLLKWKIRCNQPGHLSHSWQKQQGEILALNNVRSHWWGYEKREIPSHITLQDTLYKTENLMINLPLSLERTDIWITPLHSLIHHYKLQNYLWRHGQMI